MFFGIGHLRHIYIIYYIGVLFLVCLDINTNIARNLAQRIEQILHQGIIIAKISFYLLRRLPGQHDIKGMIIVNKLPQRHHILWMVNYQLLDPGGIIHGFMLESGKAIIQHAIADMQSFALIIHTPQLVRGNLQIGGLIFIRGDALP